MKAAEKAIGPKQLTEEEAREVIRDHLAEMAALPNPPNTDLKKGILGVTSRYVIVLDQKYLKGSKK
ncbi:hypothetical protein [Desulfotignum phosphitoxidans]|uniref:hypothetical protein n=1 Tax=Desulfotignum phosphitoxidans TaxID=190898 RepID=UPI000586C83A|nr:hypothetical protein [Desulfotignum phosphitoxidans]